MALCQLLFHQTYDTDSDTISLHYFKLFKRFRDEGSGKIDNITQNPKLSKCHLAAHWQVVVYVFSIWPRKDTILQ